MPEKIIPARDAVYVSEDYPQINYSDSAFVNVGFPESSPINRPRRKRSHYQGESIGLLQFEFDLPDQYEMLNAQLHLFVFHTRFMVNRVQIYPNREPFNGNTVTWMTRPAVQPGPVATLFVEREKQGYYVPCNITQLIKDGRMGGMPGFGVSLIGNRETGDGVEFFSNQSPYPPYVSLQYRKPSDPSRTKVESLFYEQVFEVEGTGDVLFSRTMEVSHVRTVSFFVKNIGVNSFDVNLQISPDKMDFLDDKQICRLGVNEINSLIPYSFAKYMRIRLRPVLSGVPIHARIWCQMQTYNYLMK